MAPPPPELNNDAIGEILLRLPPSDPSSLVRASLVCKPWRRILSDPSFPNRYRAFHHTPPLLGILRGFYSRASATTTSRFVPVASRVPFLLPAFGSWPLDCRHGRVLLDTVGAFWEPITGDHHLLPDPGRDSSRSGAVLCAAAGCDHRACRGGGPFLVVFVDNTHAVARASVYSSEAAAWSAPASVSIGEHSSVQRKRGALVGEELFFLFNMATKILKFDLETNVLSVIASPLVHGEAFVLISMEDGSLGLAVVKDSALHLWSRKMDPVGVATDMGVLLLVQDFSAFTFDLKSGQVKKVSKPGYYHDVFPYTSFYAPDFTSSKLQFPEEKKA